jgi:hypothetical protein
MSDTANKETYLGDGLYASFDGYQIKLRAPHGGDVEEAVYLESEVYQALLRFAETVGFKK